MRIPMEIRNVFKKFSTVIAVQHTDAALPSANITFVAQESPLNLPCKVLHLQMSHN